jgi:DNA-directed RNA polymerase specialized sigma24 family protein
MSKRQRLVGDTAHAEDDVFDHALASSFAELLQDQAEAEAEVLSGTVDCPRKNPADDDKLVGRLSPHEREVLLMHEVHGVPLQEVALALGILLDEAQQHLASARHRLRAVSAAAR